MSYIGNTSTQQSYRPTVDYFSGTGSATAFTLSRPAASVADIQVTIDNVAQNPSSAYTVSGNTITFTSAPLSGTNNIYVRYTSLITDTIAPGQGTVTSASMVAGAVGITQLSATGSPSASTYLRGDNSWATVSSPSAATPTALGTVVGQTTVNASPYTAALGYQAASGNTTATGVTAVGYQALFSNTTANGGTAVGYQAGYTQTNVNSSYPNTCVGYQANYSNITGLAVTAIGSYALHANLQSNNTAVGHSALRVTTSGENNTAVGSFAAYSNTTDSGIVAVGHQALYSNTTGSGESHNVAVGRQAMYYNATGWYSVGVGYRALYNMNATGSNTGIGYKAGQNTTSGSGNTFIGYETGKVCTTGSANIHLGYGTSTSSAGAANEIVISTNSDTGKGNQTGFIAPGFGSCYQGSNSSSWATTSDRRLKKNITDNTEGLDKITQIRVRNFEYRLPEEVDAELKSTDAVQVTGVQLGVIAQELQEVCSDCVKEESTGVLRVDSDNVFWHMVNAIKDLKALNDTQATTITALTARIVALEGQ